MSSDTSAARRLPACPAPHGSPLAGVDGALRPAYRRSPEPPDDPPASLWHALRPAEWLSLPCAAGAVRRRLPRLLQARQEYLWTDEHWRLMSTREPGGLPVIVLLEPREHVSGPADLPEELARDMGVMLGRVERAVLSVGEIGKVHIGRWGEGAEHLHWWFIGRPAGMGQLRSSFAEIWDEVLPPTPQDVWDDNLARVVAAMRRPTAR